MAGPWAPALGLAGGAIQHRNPANGDNLSLMVLLGVFQLLDCVKVATIMERIGSTSILSFLPSYLQSQNSVLRDLATTSLVKLSAIPTMVSGWH